MICHFFATFLYFREIKNPRKASKQATSEDFFLAIKDAQSRNKLFYLYNPIYAKSGLFT